MQRSINDYDKRYAKRIISEIIRVLEFGEYVQVTQDNGISQVKKNTTREVDLLRPVVLNVTKSMNYAEHEAIVATKVIGNINVSKLGVSAIKMPINNHHPRELVKTLCMRYYERQSVSTELKDRYEFLQRSGLMSPKQSIICANIISGPQPTKHWRLSRCFLYDDNMSKNKLCILPYRLYGGSIPSEYESFLYARLTNQPALLNQFLPLVKVDEANKSELQSGPLSSSKRANEIRGLH